MPFFKRSVSPAYWVGAAAFLMLLGGLNASLSQQPASPSRPAAIIPPATQFFLPRIYPGLTSDRHLEDLRADFLQIDADADGNLTRRDVELHTQMEATQVRTFALHFVMRFDINGDGAVTADEIRKAMRYDQRFQPVIPGAPRPEQVIEDTVRSIMALDTDTDGKVTVSEASKYSEPGLLRLGLGPQSERTREALTLVGGSKGEVTLADYQTAGAALFRKIDSDNDGAISPQELTDYRQRPDTPEGAARIAAAEAVQKRQREQDEAVRKKQQEAETARAGCAMPAPSPKAKVVLLGSYQTEALSSVAIGSAAMGSQDVVVHAGRINVEPGDEPLYVVISSYAAMVWQFSGAVDRVERLAMSSLMTGPNSGDEKQPPLVGATGLSRDKISFFARSNCFGYFSEMPSSESVQAIAAVREATGQEPFRVFTAPSVLGFSIPSGKVETLADPHPKLVIIEDDSGTLHIEGNPADFIVRAGPRRARGDLYYYWPGGLVEIDPKSVVASLPVQTYEVFPQEAGLVQLLESGALKQNRAGEYVVEKKTRFPAGLAGGHSVKFLVPRGVPVPDGDPGHSCVTVEDQSSARRFEPCP
jgi:Ca2+-binding EF-hand superfamily protein